MGIFNEWLEKRDGPPTPKPRKKEKPLEATCTGEAGQNIKNLLNFIKRNGKVRVVVDPKSDGEKEFQFDGNDIAFITSTEIVKVETYTNRNKFIEFIKYLGSCANPGHSFGIEVFYQEEGKERKKSYGLDGDGSDHISDVK